MPLFTRSSRMRKREQDTAARESRQARNADEGQRAIKSQTAQQKRDWLAQRTRRAAERLTSEERGPALPMGRAAPTPEPRQREWASEARFLKTYPRPSENTLSKLEGVNQYYPWPSEARFAGMVGGYEPPPLAGEPGAQPGAQPGGYYGPYSSYGYGGYGGGRGSRQPAAVGYPRRYTYLPEWLAKMAQWEI